MVNAAIFFAHLMFMLVIFTKKWQDESLSSAFTNLALIIILFAVGWSICTMGVKMIFPAKGFGIYYDADAISLTILSVVEYFFYKMYYGDEKQTGDAQPGEN